MKVLVPLNILISIYLISCGDSFRIKSMSDEEKIAIRTSGGVLEEGQEEKKVTELSNEDLKKITALSINEAQKLKKRKLSKSEKKSFIIHYFLTPATSDICRSEREKLFENYNQLPENVEGYFTPREWQKGLVEAYTQNCLNEILGS